MQTRSLLTLLLLFSVLALNGCSKSFQAASKVGQILLDPSIPVGYPEDRPSTVSLTILAEPDINPNQDGEASPINIQIVYLNEDSLFASLDHDQIEEKDGDLEKVLKKNYIDHQDYTILPGQYKPFPTMTLNTDNRYIGIIGYYSDPDNAEWKKVVKARGKGRSYFILAHIRGNEIEFRQEEDD
ncbi:type VI secretion system lipoprotein TssJ [Providencia sp.]|uniref:type VI secretion system lipoprotein TssJ n=1 Tax=unclassified Providencia TaxID=2633465 RepID=UPI001B4E2F94|nr:type VI secretion system lipoprotein TssJ [Providencia sp.]MBP6082030.1 type VI secretion system lipoprotein TssJ [Providencia sp.]